MGNWGLSAVVGCFLFGLPAEAQVTRVFNRAALGGDLTVDWQIYGQDGTFLSTPVSRTFGGQNVGLSSSSGGLHIRRESSTWHGDFAPGQYLLTQPYQSDSFIISFSPPVAALGTQIDPGSQLSGQAPYTGRFTARLCLFGTGGTFLGKVQITSTANAAETGTARFIGARSAGTPINYVSLSVTGVTPGFTVEGDLAANQLDVVTAPPRPEAFRPNLTTPTVCR